MGLLSDTFRRSKRIAACTVAIIAAATVFSLSAPLPAASAGGSAPCWREVGIPGVSGQIADIQTEASDPSHAAVVVSGSSKLYSTADGGSSWSSFTSPTASSFIAVTEQKGTQGVFYAFDSNVDIFRSGNGGEGWSNTATLSGVPASDIDTSGEIGNLVLATGSTGDPRVMHYSTDSGASFNPATVCPAEAWGPVAGDPGGDTFYASRQGAPAVQVSRSVDGGDTWSDATALPGGVHVTTLAVLPHGGPLLAGSDTAGAERVYRSGDGGVTWQPSSTGIPAGAAVNRLSVSGAAPFTVYAATGQGVFASHDGGTTWQDISNDLPAKEYLSVSGSGGDFGAVYVGTSDGFIYRTSRPYLTAVEPAQGSEGDVVSIRGVNLGDGTDSTVRFGGIDATEFGTWTGTLVNVKVPRGAQSGDLVVTTPEGESNSLEFTVTGDGPVAERWYLAEGSTGVSDEGNFETWVLVMNPGDETANATLNYMTDGGPVQGPTMVLEPQSRQSVDVSQTVPGTWSVSTEVSSDLPVIAERSVYWNAAGADRQAAHDSIGVTEPSDTWYLAEGCTGSTAAGEFETWVLIQNPGDRQANVELTYLTETGPVNGPALEVGPETRRTVDVALTLPNCWSVATFISSDEPVIAERSVYWNSAGTYRQSAHDSIGVTEPSDTWFLAEGCTGKNDIGSFETWVLVMNPGTQAASIGVEFMTPFGAIIGPDLTLEPGTRRTIDVSETVPDEWSVSTSITSDRPVIAERSIYWNTPGTYRQAATDSIGVPVAGTVWDLAEGSTGIGPEGSFETWVLIQNPGAETATVSLTYMTPDGPVDGPTLELEGNSRLSVDVSESVPNEWSVSTRVTADRPVIAERSVYWNATSQYRRAAHDSIGVSR